VRFVVYTDTSKFL
jgi:solute carrier family 25 citrate transporter 1